MLTGVYSANKKNGELYYRASITFRGKHVSLGSYPSECKAHEAYLFANELLQEDVKWKLEDYPSPCILSFHKWVVLMNFRDNKIYFKNPIYLKKTFFLYYIDNLTVLKFNAEDLFYYANHKIMKRGGHLFVSDYGMQLSVLARYGIKNYAVLGRDYRLINGDSHDLRYHNIEVINQYHGVIRTYRKNQPVFRAKIHINGDYLIGIYTSEEEAAIAYNKAALLLKNRGLKKIFPQNFIDGMDEITYAKVFQKIALSKRFRNYVERLQT